MRVRVARRSRREEAGAVAVMVAVLALVLIVVAALSVDLGNAWARGRAVQKQADVSAIGAASLLPMSTTDTRTDNEQDDIAARAAELLNQNKATGQADAVAAQLLDADPSNGELIFQNASGATCANNCVRMVLTPPEAEVDFGLGAVAASGVDVLRSATVEVFSELPPKDKVIPLWLPSGCNYGPVEGDTEGGVSPSPTPTSATTSPTATASPSGTESPSGTAEPSASSTPTPGVVIDPRGSHSLTGSSPVAAATGSTRNILNYSITGLSGNVDRASIRLVSPDGSYFIEYAVASAVPKGTMVVPPFEIGTEVTNTPGDWNSYAVVQEKGNDKPLLYSSNNLVVSVSGAAPPSPTATSPSSSPSTSPSPSVSDVPVGCAGQSRGNFGQLYSPRLDTHTHVMAYNMAFGLDHLPLPFDTTTYSVEKECAKSNGNNAIPGAQLDDVSRDGNNCIIGDTGNDGPGWFDGLISGVNGQPGRLDVAKGTTNPLCGRSDAVVGSTTINNDVLSCYLRGSGTLEKIASETGVDDSMLDPSVVESPRFVYVPMVQATDRAQKGYQPLIDYVPAFITDETQTSAATPDNGLQVSGNKISVIRLFAFNKAALPVMEQSPAGLYNTVLERPIVRLIG